MSGRLHRAAVAAVLTVGLALAATRWESPALRRPLQYDEIFSIEYHTWVGLAADGAPRRLRRMADFFATPSPGPAQVGMGLYRSLGVWREPNNHALNSALMNVTLAARRSATAARLPAFVAALVFAAATWWTCGAALGWRRAAPLVALWAYALPYVVHFGAEARGYTISLALQALLLGFAARLAQRPASFAVGTAMAAIAALTAMNLPHLALDWILPCWLALLAFPPAGAEPSAWRQTLVVQGLGVAAVVGVYFVDRLPYLYAAGRLYGESIAGVAPAAARVAGFLFPGWWSAVGAAGLVAASTLVVRGPARWIGGVALATIVLSAAHWLLVGTLPYARATAHVVPPLLVAVACGVEALLVRARTPAARLATYAILALATVPLVRAGLAEPAGEDPRVAAVERLVAAAPPANDLVYAVMPATSEYHLDKFLPVDWLDDQDPIPLGRPLDLRWFIEDGEHVGLALQQGSGEPVWPDVDCATRRCSAAVDGYRLASEIVRAVPLEETTDVAGWVLIRWQPDWTHLGLDGGALLGALDSAGVAYIRRNVREAVKLDYVGRIGAIEIVTSEPERWLRIRALLRQLRQRFGGPIVVFERAPAQ